MPCSLLRRYLSARCLVALNSLFLILVSSFLAFGQAGDTTSLYRAMRDGKVVATFKGTGGSSGDSVEVEVAKTPKAGPGPLHLTIPPGSMLHSSNGAEQSMVVMGVEGRATGGITFTPASQITVTNTKPVTYILSAFCAEFEKENPSTSDTFTLEEPVPVLACLAREGKRLSIPAQQAAVWQYTDGMTYEHMNQKFSIEAADWSAAEAVVGRCRSTVPIGHSYLHSLPKTMVAQASYAIGMNIGKSMRRDSVEVDPEILAQGIKDGLAGQSTLMSDSEVRTVLEQMQKNLHNGQAVRLQQTGEANKREGEAYLAANRTKLGVVELPSGLQYKILQIGSGTRAASTDTVICNYRGTLIDGTEFDSSYKRGQPATFPVSGVLKGWTEALQLMPVGSKWQLFIPSELAYGARGGPGGGIGPNATLIFEVELLSIQGKGQ